MCLSIQQSSAHRISQSEEETQGHSKSSQASQIPKATPQIKSSCSKMKKSVRFYPKVRVRNTVHIKEYSSAEIEQCWYTPQEWKEIERNINIVAKMVDRGYPGTDSDYFCRRGVESRTTEGSQKRCLVRKLCRDAVLQAQQDYIERGMSGHEVIARAYATLSLVSAIEAHNSALEDSDEAHKCYLDAFEMR